MIFKPPAYYPPRRSEPGCGASLVIALLVSLFIGWLAHRYGEPWPVVIVSVVVFLAGVVWRAR
jgi:F0F1-type ATP synthase assembly protein I